MCSVCSIIKNYCSYSDIEKNCNYHTWNTAFVIFIMVEMAQRGVTEGISIDYFIWKEIKAGFASLVC